MLILVPKLLLGNQLAGEALLLKITNLGKNRLPKQSFGCNFAPKLEPGYEKMLAIF